MSLVVAIISLEQEIKRDEMFDQIQIALTFIKSHSRMPILVCENAFESALVLKSQFSKYIQIDTREPTQYLVPVLDIETGLEELIKFNPIGYVAMLTTSDLRKHDVVRDDLSGLIDDLPGLLDVLERDGIFYE